MMPNKTKDGDEIMFRCRCGEELFLEIRTYRWDCNGGGLPSCDISASMVGYPNSLWDAVREWWRYGRTGHISELMMENEDVDEMVRFLRAQADKMEAHVKRLREADKPAPAEKEKDNP